MLTQTVPPEAFLYARPERENVIVDCGEYSAVRRDGEWTTERNRNHAALEAEFYRTTTKAEILEMTQREWEREYQENVKDGEIRKEDVHYIIGYIHNPSLFDERTAWLDKFQGELTPADEAWIKNTRELIGKYHDLYEKILAREA
jgi:hypothetical protein